MKGEENMEPQNKATGQSVSEQIADAIQGTDEPMEIAHPGLTPMLVMGMYPLILVVIIVLGVGYMMLSGKDQMKSPAVNTISNPNELNVSK